MLTEKTNQLKWGEIYSLGALNAAVVISWIAYHEYQPVLMEKMGITHLVDFLIISKAIILVLVPPFAGWLSDRILRKSGKYMIVLTVGIGATAMIFMVVATLISTHEIMNVKNILPFMIVLWLISMNLFISPANSMIEAFAPAQKLPIVMGFLFLITELLYALEPLVVELVVFLGDTLTFIVGGLLISGTGFLFHRISSNEVMQRKQELLQKDDGKPQSFMSYLSILIVGLYLGIGKAFLVEYLPHSFGRWFPSQAEYADILSFSLLGFAAVLGFLISRWVSRQNLVSVIVRSFGILVVGTLLVLVSGNIYLTVGGLLILATSFALINVSGLPYAIRNLNVRHVTYGVGVYIGSSEVFTGLMEYIYR